MCLFIITVSGRQGSDHYDFIVLEETEATENWQTYPKSHLWKKILFPPSKHSPFYATCVFATVGEKRILLISYIE